MIAPDLPGHGTSEVTDGQLDSDRVFAWLAELIEQTCASPPALVGHLLGGAIAARFAVDNGDRLDRLVLVGALGLGRFRPTPRFAVALVSHIARPTERTYDRLWRRCTVDLDGVREQMGERWESFAAYGLNRARTPGAKAALRTLMGEIGSPADPGGGLGANRRSRDPDLGSAQQHRAAPAERRDCERSLRLAAAGDRGRRRRSRDRTA